MDKTTEALRGDRLYGDDFSPEEIARWFQEEEDGYYKLTRQGSRYEYAYHATNLEHGYRHLPSGRFENVLGVGSAYGDELSPILDRCNDVTILEPSEGFRNPRFKYVAPAPSGLMPFPDASFDLVTCLNVLHHVPRVSLVVREVARVLRQGGHALISEPIISMGDWRRPRRGLTKNERGIPIELFRDFIGSADLTVVREHLHSFALTSRWVYVVRRPPYNSRWIVRLDSFICSLPIWFRRYHADHWIQKLRATSVFFVLRKDLETAGLARSTETTRVCSPHPPTRCGPQK
jgi:SAM-dependent methyltransferase